MSETFRTPPSTTLPGPFQLGIVGWPLEHTLSPTLHDYFLNTLDLSGTYTPYPCKAEELNQTIHQCQQNGLRGLNVTLPHKADAYRQATRATEPATLARAANTLRFEEDGTTTAHNTDIAGFLASLPSIVRTHLPKTHVVVLGAGGVAQAVVAALHYYPLYHLTIVSRSQERASTVMALAEHHQQAHRTPVAWHPWPDANQPFSPSGNRFLVINATPLGMDSHTRPAQDRDPFSPILAPFNNASSPEETFILDTVYNASNLTGCCATAHQLGLSHQDGLAMLVHQGAESFGFWTGHAIGHELRQKSLLYLRKHGFKTKAS